MTRKEALTKVLEAGRKVFKNGGAFSVNGMLLANYNKTAEINFDYDDRTETVVALYMRVAGNTLACIFAAEIIRVSVSDDNILLTNDDLTKVYGRVDGERFSIKKGGE